MNSQKTLLAAAVLFALAACQPEPVGNNATAAAPLAGSAQDDQDPPDPQPVPPDEDEDEDNGDERDAEPATDDVAASPAQATEHADAAATDALLDTREGGNPLANPAMPVEPIAESDEDDEDDDEDKR
jgi:hypothetical protein